MNLTINAADVQRVLGSAETAITPSRDWLVRHLAMQAETEALKRAQGPNSAPAGAYPIPVRTGKFFGAFGVETRAGSAIVFNASEYARPLHDGFRPYGNPRATPIPARPYFSDALDAVDIDAAHAAWEHRWLGAADWGAMLAGGGA
ncbi:hypothetical protein [Stenotrophomonas sp. MMGLT7]|uniref:hypothetical protein n=1 Tax=Stenotrophomonas sp. MMGLT7 TaxID=2901227 RepID=UPI001E379801|nr:hypothetical protein [Stenotrophomonas sp. MMGLT7]MCD7096939.1 hypothetical protein [Stenotrophomonas sp. MMGLT7]